MQSRQGGVVVAAKTHHCRCFTARVHQRACFSRVSRANICACLLWLQRLLILQGLVPCRTECSHLSCRSVTTVFAVARSCGLCAVLCCAVRALMRVCQSSQGQQGTCGFFGSGGYLLYEITEGQVRQKPTLPAVNHLSGHNPWRQRSLMEMGGYAVLCFANSVVGMQTDSRPAHR
jgi:hypothetical protein